MNPNKNIKAYLHFYKNNNHSASFNNGKVAAFVDYFESERRLIIIDWATIGEKRTGNSRSTLQFLRPYFTSIKASPVNSKNKDAVAFWSQMLKEGLIDSFESYKH